METNDPSDPVVARVRAAREALARQCDYDVDKMMQLFRSMQAKRKERVSAPQQQRDAKSAHPG